MVSHPKTPIFNCFYHLLWFYFFTVSGIQLLGQVIICVWPTSFAPYS